MELIINRLSQIFALSRVAGLLLSAGELSYGYLNGYLNGRKKAPVQLGKFKADTENQRFSLYFQGLRRIPPSPP